MTHRITGGLATFLGVALLANGCASAPQPTPRSTPPAATPSATPTAHAKPTPQRVGPLPNPDVSRPGHHQTMSP